MKRRQETIRFLTLDRLYKRIFPYEHALELLLQLHPTALPVRRTFSSLSHRRNFNKIFTRLVIKNNLSVALLPSLRSLLEQGLLARDTYEAIKTDAFMVKLRGMEKERDYIKIVKALRSEKIPFIIMKTYPLSRTIFMQHTIKLSQDLDILVSTYFYDKAVSLFAYHGFVYIPNPRKPAHALPMSSASIRFPKTQQLFRKGDCFIDLHTSVTDFYDFFSYAISAQNGRNITRELSLHTTRTTVGKSTVRSFTPTALFISLFLHVFLQHNFRQVILYYEVFKVLTLYKHDVKWMSVFSFMNKYKLTLYFGWFLSLFNMLFPRLLSSHIQKLTNDYTKPMWLTKIIVWYYMRYKLFHPAPGLLNHNERLEKRFMWAVVDNGLFRLVGREIRRRLRGMYDEYP